MGARPLLEKAGRLREDEVARAATDAAAAAVAPFAEEAARAAVRWAAARWPRFARDTVLPALEEAVGAEPPPREADRRPLLAAALVGATVVAGVLGRRRAG